MSAEKIRAILESGADIEDAVLASDDKDIFYHLSPLRANLLSWIDFKEDASVLEINAECGALTGILCEKAKHVTAVDPSKENCEINAIRNKYENLELITGEFRKIKFTQPFDYITIVGLPEKLLKKTIAKAATLLAPGGQLILAGEGDTKQADKYLVKAGFKETKTYFPAPDYRIPLEIRTDMGEGSFLIFAKIDGTCDQAVSYVKFACLRRPEFRIFTAIPGDHVIKRPLTSAASEHIRNLASNREMVAGLYNSIDPVDCEIRGDSAIFPFIEGESLTIEDLDKVFDYKEPLSRFEVTDKFREVFGDIDVPEGEQAYPMINVDSNLDNFMVSNGKMYCIDYEWIFDFPIPVRFVRYRTLFYAGISPDKFADYGYSEEDVKFFHNMEIAFQQYVSGEGFKYIFEPSRYK